MIKRRYKILILILIVLLLTLAGVFYKRIARTVRYYRFVSTPENRKLLNEPFRQEVWTPAPAEHPQTLSLGFASFDWPVDQITEVILKNYNIIIKTPKAKLFFGPPHFIDTTKPVSPDEFTGFHKKYYQIKNDFKFVENNHWKNLETQEQLDQYFQSAHAVGDFLDTYINDNNYAWGQYLFSLKPKSSMSVFFMGESRFDWYLFGLKAKIKFERPSDVIFFQTDQWQGTLGTSIKKSEKEEHASEMTSYTRFYAWTVNRQNKCIHPLVFYAADPSSIEHVKQLYCSLQYNMDLIHDYYAWRFTSDVIDTITKLPHFHTNADMIAWSLVYQDDSRVPLKLIPYVDDINNKECDWQLGEGENEYLFTPLIHIAAGDGTPAIVQAVLDAGGDINAGTPLKQTPLHIAAMRNDPSIIKLLLAAGSNPNAKDLFGFTPLALTTSPQTAGLLKPVTSNAERKTPAEDWPIDIETARRNTEIKINEWNKSRMAANRRKIHPESITEKYNEYEGYYVFIYPKDEQDITSNFFWIKVDAFTGIPEIIEPDCYIHYIDLQKYLNPSPNQ